MKRIFLVDTENVNILVMQESLKVTKEKEHD